MSDECLCSRTVRGYSDGKHFICVRCLNPRRAVRTKVDAAPLGCLLDDYYLGPIGGKPTPNGMLLPCWLNCIPTLASLATGEWLNRLSRITDYCYDTGVVTESILDGVIRAQVGTVGCSVFGPHLFVSRTHIDLEPFPGCRWVIAGVVSAGRLAGAIHFSCGDVVLFAAGCQGLGFLAHEGCYMLFKSDNHERLPKVPDHLKGILDFMLDNWPVGVAYLPVFQPAPTPDMRGTRLGVSVTPRTAIRHPYPEGFGTCWAQLFPAAVRDHEIDLAARFGYLLTEGVPVPYLYRRLHVRGLRLIPGDTYTLSALTPGCWIGHIALTASNDHLPDEVLKFDVVSACTAVPPLRLPNHMYVGGKKRRGGAVIYSPPSDGNCGRYCVAAAAAHASGLKLTSTERYPPVGPAGWLSDSDILQLAQDCNLSVSIFRGRRCPSAAYIVRLNAAHWSVEATGQPNRELPLECQHGICTHEDAVGDSHLVPVRNDVALGLIRNYKTNADRARDTRCKTSPQPITESPPPVAMTNNLAGGKPEDDVKFALLNDGFIVTDTGTPPEQPDPPEERRWSCLAGKLRMPSIITFFATVCAWFQRPFDCLKQAEGKIDRVFRSVPHLRARLTLNVGADFWTQPLFNTFVVVCCVSLAYTTRTALTPALLQAVLLFSRGFTRTSGLIGLSIHLVLYFGYLYELSTLHLDCSVNAPACETYHRFLNGNDGLSSVSTPGFGLLSILFNLAVRLHGMHTSNYRVWSIVVSGIDLAIVVVAFCTRNMCRKCFRRCIRTQRGVIDTVTVPVTRVTAKAMIDFCDRYAAPPTDLVSLYTGFPGCYRGKESCCTVGTAIPYSRLNKSKISTKTLVQPPLTADQAATCFNAIAAGASIAIEPLPQVEKVTAVPFAHPVFGDLPVNPDVNIVVDQAVLMATGPRPGLVPGVGDFAVANRLKPKEVGGPATWVPRVLTEARKQMLTETEIVIMRNAGFGGMSPGILLYVVYICVCLFINFLLQTRSSCGVGTSDPWALSPFCQLAPVLIHSEAHCVNGLCYSAAGVSTSLVRALTTSWAYHVGAVMITLPIIAVTLRWALGHVEAIMVLVAAVYALIPLTAFTAVVLPAIALLGVSPWFYSLPIGVALIVNPAAGALGLLSTALIYLTRYVKLPCSLVLPNDIHAFTRTARSAAALASAPPESYLGCVKAAALTGSAKIWIPSDIGIILEGALRSPSISKQCVTVVGNATGAGSVWRLGNRLRVISATHVTGKHASVSYAGKVYDLDFTATGDCSYADFDGPIDSIPHLSVGVTPAKAFWLTSTGTEVGAVLANSVVCFTKPGDSGSAVVDQQGRLLGVHTGSNGQGVGAITTLKGETIGFGTVLLSELSSVFSGDLVQVPDRIPSNIVNDCSMIPSTLHTALSADINAEGALGGVQLFIGFFLLWRCAPSPIVCLVATCAFLLNEILPKPLARSIFACMMDLVQVFTLHSQQVFLLKLLTAALANRPATLMLNAVACLISMSVDYLPTYFFIPRSVALLEPVMTLGAIVLVHVTLCLLEVFGIPAPARLMRGEGMFSRVFMAKYFEGKSDEPEPPRNLSKGVSQSCGLNGESLSAYLAANVDKDILEKLASLPVKVIRSASNIANSVEAHREILFAKALRASIVDAIAGDKAKGLMAKLAEFVAGIDVAPSPGDTVLFLGKVPGNYCVRQGVCYRLGAIHNLAGTCVTEAVVEDKPLPCEDDGRLPKKYQEDEYDDTHVVIGKQRYRRRCEKNGDVTFSAVGEDGAHYTDKASYKMAFLAKNMHCEGVVKPTTEQAMAQLGLDPSVDIEALRRLIARLQDLERNAALNLLRVLADPLHTRNTLFCTTTSVGVTNCHDRTFFFPRDGFCIKVVDLDELEKTPYGQVAIRHKSHGILARNLHPTVLDAVLKPILPMPSIPFSPAQPGDCDILGNQWDFESEPPLAAVSFTAEICAASRVANGEETCPGYPYYAHPVSGDPYRENGYLKNTRFGDIKYKTPTETGDLLHATACFNPAGVKVLDGENVVGTTMPTADSYYVPTIPTTVLTYLDSRGDMPVYYTKHGTEEALGADLQKYELSKQGFVLPSVLRMVRDYLFEHVGPCPPLYRPSDVPSRDSASGVNGARFRTKWLQKYPGIDEIVDRAMRERWQTVTAVTPKKQYCPKLKTRTILGTNNFIGLGLRAALSGVTSNFLKAGHNSPICLGKNKYRPLSSEPRGLCLEADLVSCDRSTPAIIRHFCTNLLFELAGMKDYIDSYVINCCHDLLVTSRRATTKRGGLSSGDAVTSISNTIYSLVIYAQHMCLSFLRARHPLAGKVLSGTLTLAECLEVQPVLIYSDDVVLHSPTFPNYQYWNSHLTLLLQFEFDSSKTVITATPSFLGCRIIGRSLVPNRDRILAALGYHMGASNVYEYYAAAAAILQDSVLCLIHDRDWYCQLVQGIGLCAVRDGVKFPGVDFFQMMLVHLTTEKANVPCTYCCSSSVSVAECGTRLCVQHLAYHNHCPVVQPWCGHAVGSAQCPSCLKVSPQPCPIPWLAEVYEQTPMVKHTWKTYHEKGELSPGRYKTILGSVITIRKTLGGVDYDGAFPVRLRLVPSHFAGIHIPTARINAIQSTIFEGPPGCGKTRRLLQQLKDDDVVYSPTRVGAASLVNSIGKCQHTLTEEDVPPSHDEGPRVVIMAAGYVAGGSRSSRALVDEVFYCNTTDLLRLLTNTPIIGFGDRQQLLPVGFSSYLPLLDLARVSFSGEVFRFGPNICKAISKFYPSPIWSHNKPTSVIYHQTPCSRGLVLTPYHHDRAVGDIIASTIDSVQGLTAKEITIHLPTKNSLTVRRALVAITRATDTVNIYDPHQQLAKLMDLPPLRCEHLQNTEIKLSASGNLTASIGWGTDHYVFRDPHPDDVRPYVVNPSATLYTKAREIFGDRLSVIKFESQQLSPLPRVANNLGYWYSPDLPAFFKIPEQLCVNWPIVTGKNNLDWPNRLVVTLKPLCPSSMPAECAGFMVGDSTFHGSPGVASYYLTEFKDGKPHPLINTLFSTGRFETNYREYLDDHEKAIALAHEHAYIGEDNKSVIGGSHHITSKFLPSALPAGDAVVKVGVASVGKSVKGKCSVTDVYLPLLEPYMQPDTQSKVYSVAVDFKTYRFMVWRNATSYFQLESSTSPLQNFASFVSVGKGITANFDPALGPVICNIPTHTATYQLSVGFYCCEGEYCMTTSDEPSPNYKLIGGRLFVSNGSRVAAYLYRYAPGDWCVHNIAGQAWIWSRPPIPVRSKIAYQFLPGAPGVVESEAGLLLSSVKVTNGGSPDNH
nr:MAG: ORF1ab polyprotein [Wufeng rodent arterivirus 1]